MIHTKNPCDLIQIVDVIDHRNKYSVQRFLVLDRIPQFTYERRGSGLLIGHDSGFFKFFGYEAPGPTWSAFGGDKFDIPMADGSVIKASGQWWNTFPSDFKGLTYEHGVGTVEGLGKCNVFSGCIHVDRDFVDAWLFSNETSNNYEKYNPRHADFGKQTIVSPWEPVACNQPNPNR